VYLYVDLRRRTMMLIIVSLGTRRWSQNTPNMPLEHKLH